MNFMNASLVFTTIDVLAKFFSACIILSTDRWARALAQIRATTIKDEYFRIKDDLVICGMEITAV